MSEDLIRRSDAIKVAKEFWYKPDIAGALAELPTIEPKAKVVAQVTFDEEKLREIVKEAVERFKEEYEIEPKRGEWIDMGDFEQCSVCKGTHLKGFQSYYGKTTWIKTPYCPNCGARMKGADDE